jgi:hypothetical protein
MSDTPKTDAALCRLPRVGNVVMDLVPFGQIVPADFARELERENAKLRERVGELQTLIDNELEHLARGED